MNLKIGGFAFSSELSQSMAFEGYFSVFDIPDIKVTMAYQGEKREDTLEEKLEGAVNRNLFSFHMTRWTGKMNQAPKNVLLTFRLNSYSCGEV